jgi:hypothetical protein
VIHSPLSLLLVAILAAYLLHAMWRVAAGRDGVATACLVAGYLTLGILLRLTRPDQPMSPLLLPFVYPYAWLGLAALFWLPVAVRPTRAGLVLCAGSAKVGGILLSALLLHVGILALAPLTGAGSLTMYLLLPPLVALQAWLVGQVFFLLLRRSDKPYIGWLSLVALTLIPGAVSLGLARALVPVLLRYF